MVAGVGRLGRGIWQRGRVVGRECWGVVSAHAVEVFLQGFVLRFVRH